MCGNRGLFIVRALVWLGDTTSDPRIERWEFDPDVRGDMLVEDTGGRSVLCMVCGNSWQIRADALPAGGAVWPLLAAGVIAFWVVLGYIAIRFVGL